MYSQNIFQIELMFVYKHIQNLLSRVCISLCRDGCRALQYYRVLADGEFSTTNHGFTPANCTQSYAKFIIIMPCTFLSSVSFCLFHLSFSLTVRLTHQQSSKTCSSPLFFPLESTCQKYELLTSHN